jgi:glycosyltransferase involved in cell wall biosynthesis
VRVSVVIPTYNEAQSIGLVLADIPAAMVEQVLVVDSDSTDGTAEIARQMGAEVLHEPRRGYGRACLTGLAAVNAPEAVVFLDRDYGDRPAEMARLLVSSSGRELRASVWQGLCLNRLAARLIAFLSGVRLTDLGPFRAARYEVLIALGLRECTYGWPVEMIVRARGGDFELSECG